jgi:hypothetical protein
MVVGPHSQATDWMLCLPHLLAAELGVLWAADAAREALSAVPDCRHRALPDPAHAVPAKAPPAALMECQTETVHLPQAARKLPLPACPAGQLGLELAAAAVLARELMDVAALRAMVMKAKVLAMEQEQLRAPGGSGASATGGAGPGTSGGTGSSGPGSSAGSPSGSPSGTNPDAVNIGAGGRPFPADIPRARPPILDNPPGPQDLPVRVIGLAMSLPSSSYFSNYEVFIAERRVSKDESQLIKLVYESLPYQRRLSEYGLNNRVFKLRVTRDPSCDESLIQMTWPDADQGKTGAKPATDSPELKSGHDDKLPCYRTTADAYRKALSHGH